MDHLVDNIAVLCLGRPNQYICREAVPMNDSSGETCNIIKSLDLSL